MNKVFQGILNQGPNQDFNVFFHRVIHRNCGYPVNKAKPAIHCQIKRTITIQNIPQISDAVFAQ